jgi:cell division septation protein DedD
MGMGIEYMSSIVNNPAIPFVTASLMPMSRMMIFGEYDHGVRFKGLLNYYPGGNSTLELDYTKYAKNQQAILYNYLEERKASFSIPLRVKNVSGFVRAEYKQNVYSNLNYNISELLFSGYYKQFNVNLSTYANWVSNKSAYMNSMIALAYRMRKGYSLRASTQFSFSGEKFLSYKVEAEKRFIHNGYISVTYENNTAVNNSSVNFNFKYDLAFAQTNASARVGKHEVSTFQNVRGSLLFGKGKKQIKASELSSVGRGGLSIIPFIDLNNNGVFDKNEHKAANLKVLINGGRIVYSERDSIINIIGLEPFISYNLQLDDKDFENLSWRIHEKTYKVMIDPDQLKIITVPVIPVGEVNGTINLEDEGHLSGIGRILIDFYTEEGIKVGQTLSESDGYFGYLGLNPGKYIARIDSVQLSRLEYISDPKEIVFAVNESDEGDIVENVNFTLKGKVIQKKDDTTAVKKEVSENFVKDIPETRDSLKPVLQKFNHIQHNQNKTNLAAMTPSDTIKTVSEEIGMSIDSTRDDHFYVQIGAFRSLSKTEKFKSDLQGQISYPEALIVEDGFYKIRIGYFNSKDEAELYSAQLKEKGMIAFVGQSLLYGYPGKLPLETGPFFVGAGSFRYKKSAMQYARKIKEQIPFTCGVIEEEGLFKVRFGYFKSKADASACMMKMKELGIKGVPGESNTYIYSGTLYPEISNTMKK